jgi:hypothetical protein
MAFSTPETLITADTLTLARYNKLRDSIIANAFGMIDMGGSRTAALSTGGGYIAIPDWEDFTIPSTDYTGHVFKLSFEVLTENAATTVTVKLRNVTDSTDTYTSSAITTTAWGTEQLSTSLTIAAGKVYQVQASKSDDLYDCWVVAKLRRTHA